MQDSNDTAGHIAAVLAERYRVERELGAGGMSVVYLAHDQRHDRPVALKILRGDIAATLGVERFLQEIRTTARLQHPHILPLLDSGEAAGHLFYVMPYVDGETLRARLTRQRAFPIPDVITLASQLAGALESAHRRGIIHRDIKPENILISEELPLLVDFGIALALQKAGGDRLTEVGVAVGTPAYMSPEQIAGTGELDARSDIYSLACVVFETIAGEPPYQGANGFATMTAHVTAAIPTLTSPFETVPPSVAAAVRKALAKEPADRFATASEFAAALRRTTADHRVATPPPREKSIVVLPFDNLSPDPNDAYLADGLTDEITGDLSRIGSIRVTARNSAVAAKARTRDVREIAALLSARYVLEGSVRRAGSALRISSQLIDGETGTQLWSDRYNGTMEDVFAMQERISRTIFDALQVRLSSDDSRQLATHPIENLPAYQLYLQARALTRQLTGDALLRARQLLDEAVMLSGENHLLLGALGVNDVIVYTAGIDTREERLHSGDRYASRALALNPQSAEGLYAKALIAEKRDLALSTHYLRGSVAASPLSDAMALLAYSLALRAEAADALHYARWAVQLDPMSSTVLGWAAMAAWYSNFPDQAADWGDAMLRAGDAGGVTWIVGGFLFALIGQRSRAIELFDAGIASGEETIEIMCRTLASGVRGEAPPRIGEGAVRRDPHASLLLAEAFAAGNDKEASFDWLRNALRLGVTNSAYMTDQSPYLAKWRDDPEFTALIAEAP